MKLLNTLTFLLFVTAFPALGQDQISYFDDFNDNGFNWAEERTVKSSSKVVYGNYEMFHKRSSGGYCYYKDFYQLARTDYYIETKIMHTLGDESNGYGIIWGAKNANNGYNFMISSNGYFSIGNWTEGKYKAIKSWSKNSAVLGKYKHNTLAIKQKAGKLYFYINGKEVHSIQSLPLKGHKTGFNLKSAMKVKADYFKFEYIKEKINLIPNAKKGYVKVNLGQNINSLYVEKSPVIAHDGKTIYYTRSKHPQNISEKDDAWVSSSLPGDHWSEGKSMGKPINNAGHNFVVSISPDNNLLILGNTYKSDGSQDTNGLSHSKRTKNGWELPKTLQIDDFYNDNDYVNYCLAPSGKTLILAVERDDSKGDQDLYYSTLKSDGTWTTPKHMGNTLNTITSEFSPFLAADNRTLYFASYGHPGYGSADIFVSKRIGDGWTQWTTPQNLGPEINTDQWDAYFSIPADGKYAYMVSQKGSIGEEDIFRIKIKEDEPDEDTEPSREEIIVKKEEGEIEVKFDEKEDFVKEEDTKKDKSSFTPDPVVVIYGKVLDANTNAPLDASLFYENLKSKKELGLAHSNPATGEYKIILPYGEHYGFTAQASKHIAISDNVNIEGTGEYIEIEKNFYLVPIELGKPVRINNVFFARSKASLLSTSFPELDRLAKFMKDNPNMTIRLEGHTDGIGNPVDLMKLSWDRVAAVKKYLTSKGVNTDRIEGKGYGRSRPIAPNNNEENRKKNRRVEFVITKI